MSQIEIFLWGFGGSMAVEVITLYGLFSIDAKKSLPRRYRQVGFWVTRIVLAIIAGGLALAYHVNSSLLAFHVGAATPLIVQTIARTLPQI